MATEVGAVEVVLRARIDQLERDLKRAEGSTKTTANRMRANFTKIAASVRQVKGNLVGVAAVAGGLATGAMANLARQAIKTANDLGDVASKLGISTTALQELQFAANQSGVRVEALNMGLPRFGRRAAEAANGTGEARAALRQLGIQLRDTDGNLRSTEELFTDAMTSLAEIEDPLERVRLGFKLFDSEGVALVNMADDFGTLREEAQRLGLVIDDEVIARSDELQDSFDALWAVTKGQLTPALVALGGSALKGTLETMAALAGWANKLYRNFADIQNLGLANAEAKLNEQREKAADLTERSEKAEKSRNRRSVITLTRQLNETNEEVDRLEKHIAALTKKREDEAPAASGGGGGGDTRTQAQIDKAENDRLKAIERRRSLAQRAHEEWLEASGQRVRAIEEELARDLEALNTNLQAGEDYTEARVKLEKTAALRIKEIRDEEAEALQDNVVEQESVYSDLFDFMERGFSDALATMLLDGEITFKSLAQSFLREFVQMGIGQLVGKAFGALGSLFGPSTGNSAINTTGGNPYVGFAANGGPISGPTLVGERGPELFLPGTSGFIANNLALGKIAGARGGAPVNVTVINNSGAEASTTERDGPNGTRSIEVMIGNAISKNISRGGDVDQAIRNSYGVQRVGRHGI